MSDEINLWLIGGGGAIGMLFGIVVQRSRFCMVSAISNLALMRDFRHFHAYLAAVSVAVVGTTILEFGGWVAIAETSYRDSHFDWLGLLLGGLLFGFGSMLAGGCAGRTVVRTAEGNLGALVTLLAFGLAAAATYYGVLSPVREWMFTATAAQLSGDATVAAVLGMRTWAIAITISLGCLVSIAVLGTETRSPGLIAAGGLIGVLVVAGWWITGYLSVDDFSEHAPGSLTFANPLAKSAVFVATGNAIGHGFALALLGGTVLGAAISALLTRTFHWTPPQASHIGRLLMGGTLMGIGAIMSGGCNIGQGLSGVSTTSIKALIAVAAIITGMRMGLSWLQRKEAGF